MIRRLKFKFIFTNMALITVVMFAAFGTLLLNTQYELKENSRSAMQEISKIGQGKFDYVFDPNRDPKEKYPYISTYIIDIEESSNTCYIDGFEYAETLTPDQERYINELINFVRSDNNVEGIITKYNLRYFCTQTPYGTRIVLLDKRYEDDSLRVLSISLVIIGSIVFGAFLCISFVVASIAIKPVENTFNRQKQFIADISHELKTPITVIATNADIIMSHESSTVKEEQKWLGYIKDSTTRMSEMVNNMLYLAKTDEADEKPILKDFNFSNAAYETVLPFESVCFENGKTLEIEIENNVLVHADEISIKRLMVILLDNAIKYSNEHGDIKFSLKSNGDKVILSVFNTGDPIPKDSIPYIFERFYRVDKDRSREKGGSGLGLSLAKRIIENNDGAISVASTEATGTVFTCIFKAAKVKRKDKKEDI